MQHACIKNFKFFYSIVYDFSEQTRAICQLVQYVYPYEQKPASIQKYVLRKVLSYRSWSIRGKHVRLPVY